MVAEPLAPATGAGEPLPPFDAEAEQAVIASLLVDEDAMARVAAIVRPDDFFRPQNQWCYQACLALYERGEAINQVTVAHELARMNLLEQAGGIAYLGRIVAELPTPVGVEHYAGIVRRDAQYRRLIAAAGKIAQMAYRGGPNLDETLSRAANLIFEIQAGERSGDFRHIRTLLEEYWETPGIESLGASIVGSVRTGFVDLDTLLGGLKRSDLIIIAARPGIGKSTLAMNIARNAAIGQNARVAVFSLEMSGEQLAQRLLAGESGVDLTRVRLGEHTEAEERRIMHAMGVLADAEIYIDDTAVQRVEQIHAKADRLKREKGSLDLVIVDYLQLIRGSGGENNRVQEVSHISRSLKALARELDVPVIAASQLSRAPEQRHPHVPMLSDLRESGSIEQDADIVMFIYREEVYLQREEWEAQHPDLPAEAFPAGIAQIIVAKHRNGPTGTVHLRFRNHLSRFEDLLVRDEEEAL